MTIKDIVQAYLVKEGYDGLCDPHAECGCEVNDLMPCYDELSPHCEAGHRRKPPADLEHADCDWLMYPGKAAENE